MIVLGGVSTFLGTDLNATSASGSHRSGLVALPVISMILLLGCLISVSIWAYRQFFGHGKLVQRQPMSRMWIALTIVAFCAWTWLSGGIFVMFGLPATVSTGDAGVIDRKFWPYTGVGKSTVSLVPPVPIYDRLVIQEVAEGSRLGYGDGSFRLASGNTGLTKLTFTLTVDPGPEIKPDPPIPPLAPKREVREAPPVLIIDGLDFSWRYVDARDMGKEQGHDHDPDSPKRSGALVDAAQIASWLRLSCPNARALDDKLVRAHAEVLADIIRDAAERLTGRPVLPTHSDNKIVSRLHHAVVFKQQSSQGTAFRSVNASPYNPTWTTEVPILWVSMPLALAMWTFGIWLIFVAMRGKPIGVSA